MADDDINILGEADVINKSTKKKVKGLKDLNTTLTAAEKEMASIATKLDKLDKRDKSIAFTRNRRALKSIGITGKALAPAMLKFNRTPMHAAYAMLAANGAPEHILRSIARNASAGAQAHIAGQMPIGANTSIAGMGNTSNIRTQSPILAQAFSSAQSAQIDEMKGASSIRGQVGAGLNTPIPGLRSLSIASAMAALAVTSMARAIQTGVDARTATSAGRDTPDRIKRNFAQSSGIPMSQIEDFHRRGGSGSLNILEKMYQDNIASPSPGNMRRIFNAAAPALDASQDPSSVLSSLGNTAELNRLASMKGGNAAGIRATNQMEYDKVNKGQKASLGDKLFVNLEQMRKSNNTNVQNWLENFMPGYTDVANEIYATGFLGENNKKPIGQGYGEVSRDQRQVLSPRPREIRSETFDSTGGGGRVQTVHVDNPQPKPATNPYLGSN